MKVNNWTDKVNPPPPAHDLNPLAPVWPFRLLTIGPSGSGKTNAVCDLIMNHIYYDNIFLFAKDLEEPLYEFLAKFFRCMRENPETADDAPHFMSSNMLEDVPDLESLNPSEQNLFIFDDMVTAKDQSGISEYFIRSRKKNCSCIYISQSYFNTPKLIRENCNYFMCFKLSEKRQITALCSTHASDIDYKRFRKLYNEIMRKKHAFMLIDKRTDIPNMRFRNGWDCILTNPYDDSDSD
jgi:hypothetical protein